MNKKPGIWKISIWPGLTPNIVYSILRLRAQSFTTFFDGKQITVETLTELLHLSSVLVLSNAMPMIRNTNIFFRVNIPKPNQTTS